MMAVIIAAGPSRSENGFPLNSKPKCLHHFQGEVILDRQIRLLKKYGVNRIRMVVGYHSTDIYQFCEDRGHNVELIHNPDWATDIMKTIEMGVNGIDDDVLLIMGDAYITEKCLRNVLKNKHPMVVTYRSHKLQRVFMFDLLVDEDIIKISKEKLSQLRGIRKYYANVGSDMGLGHTLANMRRANNFVYEETYGTIDLDQYDESDEHKQRKFLWMWRLLYAVKQFLYVKKCEVIEFIASSITEIQKKKAVGYTVMTACPLTYRHLEFIQKCKFYCKYLVVGLYTDDLVRASGISPREPFEMRAEMVKAIRCVDDVKKVEVKNPEIALENLVKDGYNIRSFLLAQQVGISSSEEVTDYMRSIGGQVKVVYVHADTMQEHDGQW